MIIKDNVLESVGRRLHVKPGNSIFLETDFIAKIDRYDMTLHNSFIFH